MRRGIELEDAEGLFGPVVVVCQQVRDEAARLAQSLGFGEMPVRLPEPRLRPLSVVDVGQEHIPTDNASGLVAQGKSTELKPTVGSIEAPDARLEVVWIA